MNALSRDRERGGRHVPCHERAVLLGRFEPIAEFAIQLLRVPLRSVTIVLCRWDLARWQRALRSDTWCAFFHHQLSTECLARSFFQSVEAVRTMGSAARYTDLRILVNLPVVRTGNSCPKHLTETIARSRRVVAPSPDPPLTRISAAESAVLSGVRGCRDGSCAEAIAGDNSSVTNFEWAAKIRLQDNEYGASAPTGQSRRRGIDGRAEARPLGCVSSHRSRMAV